MSETTHTHAKGFMCRILECPDRRPECSHEDGRFISQVSFVGLPPGTDVPMEGTVVCCDVCERSGIVRQVENGGHVVIHVQDTEVFGHGSRVDPEDVCRPPKA